MERFTPISNRKALVPLPFQQAGYHLSNRLFIVRNQNLDMRHMAPTTLIGKYRRLLNRRLGSVSGACRFQQWVFQAHGTAGSRLGTAGSRHSNRTGIPDILKITSCEYAIA